MLQQVRGAASALDRQHGIYRDAGKAACPFAAGQFSMKTVTLSCAPSRWASTRKAASVMPPGGSGRRCACREGLRNIDAARLRQREEEDARARRRFG